MCVWAVYLLLSLSFILEGRTRTCIKDRYRYEQHGTNVGDLIEEEKIRNSCWGSWVVAFQDLRDIHQSDA